MPAPGKTLIPVRRETQRLLNALKVILGARSYDDVIRRLIEYAPESVRARVTLIMEAGAHERR